MKKKQYEYPDYVSVETIDLILEDFRTSKDNRVTEIAKRLDLKPGLVNRVIDIYIERKKLYYGDRKNLVR